MSSLEWRKLSTLSYQGSGDTCNLPGHLNWMCLAVGVYHPLQHKSFGLFYAGDKGAECCDNVSLSLFRELWELLGEGLGMSSLEGFWGLKLQEWIWRSLWKNLIINALCKLCLCSLEVVSTPKVNMSLKCTYNVWDKTLTIMARSKIFRTDSFWMAWYKRLKKKKKKHPKM